MGDRIDGILLAAGLSRRFGAEDKLLTPVGGEPLVARTLRMLAGLEELERVICVCSSDSVERLASEQGAVTVRNPSPEEGISGSIRLGIARSDADYYLFAVGDQPYLSPEVVKMLLAAREPGKIVTPAYGGRTGNPVLFPRGFREELLALTGEEGGKVICRRRPERVIRVEIPQAKPLLDVDTKDDFDRLIRQNE